MILMKMLLMMLKNGLTHWRMMKEEKEKIITYRENKKVIGLMKDERGGKKLQNLQQIHQKDMVTKCKKIILK